ncbi:hypothetical protein JX266_007560 [Neoarthrinium moseri]|nr:hypothetical protein JX266_007560 [Neoarthrinium moseri]
MPVTIKTTAHGANLTRPPQALDHAKQILDRIDPDRRHGDLIQSSFDADGIPGVLQAENNGFKLHGPFAAHKGKKNLVVTYDTPNRCNVVDAEIKGWITPAFTTTTQHDIVDYGEILRRLDKLALYVKEPTQFGNLLKPTMTRFIRSFDEPDNQQIIDFWGQICDEEHGSGFDTYTGWITAA